MADKSKTKTKRKAKALPEPTDKTRHDNFVIIDTSYLVFYRFYATILWYKKANRDVDTSGDYSWHTDEVFLEKFKKIFYQSIQKLIKRFNAPTSNIIFALDCPRRDIWRMPHIETYKSNRDDVKKSPSISHLFKYTYDTVLPFLQEKYGVKIVRVNRAEADDVAAVITNSLLETYSEREVLIITNDCDYIQLLQPRVHIWNLQGKNLESRSVGDPAVDLQLKIILGDKSDNIDKCFPKCGTKTALKYIADPTALEKAFEKYPGSKLVYERNSLIIDFNNIPNDIQLEIKTALSELKF
jgi:5'-3' exonuclease